VKDELSGPRVRLRPWRHMDTITQDSWPPFTDPTQVFWHIPRQMTAADLNWSYDYDPSRYVWAVETHKGTLVGRISLRDIDKRKAEARLGISFGSPYVSQGLGTEALEIFLSYAFGPLGFRRILLDVAGPNRRAIHCYERLGFRYTGSDWRAPSASDNLRFLDDPTYRDILPYVRRDRHGTWVQFFDMELSGVEWRERQQRAAAGGNHR
jgi:RimJ/RimL family protein N-acetyltransferase